MLESKFSPDSREICIAQIPSLTDGQAKRLSTEFGRCKSWRYLGSDTIRAAVRHLLTS